MALDPISGEKVPHEVLVSYPSKPLSCTGCRDLGHLVGACQKVTRRWVRKVKPSDNNPVHTASTPLETQQCHNVRKW